MAKYKYRVTGPRGGKYLCSTLAEAKELTKAGGSFRKLPTVVSKRNPGRPRNGTAVERGDVYRVKRAWLATVPEGCRRGGMASPERFEAGDRVQVLRLESGGKVVAYEKQQQGRTYGLPEYTMDTRLFLARVTELQENAGGRELRDHPVGRYGGPIYGVDETAFSGGGDPGRTAVMDYLIHDKRQFAAVMRRTIRYILKKIMAGDWYQTKEDAVASALRKGMTQKAAENYAESAPMADDLWKCAVLAGIRNLALTYGIDNYADIFSEEDIATMAHQLNEWFVHNIQTGKIAPEDMNVFGSISISERDDGHFDYTGNRNVTQQDIHVNPAPDRAPWLPHDLEHRGVRAIRVSNPADPAEVEKEIETTRELLSIMTNEKGENLEKLFGTEFVESMLSGLRSDLLEGTPPKDSPPPPAADFDPKEIDEKKAILLLKDRIKALSKKEGVPAHDKGVFDFILEKWKDVVSVTPPAARVGVANVLRTKYITDLTEADKKAVLGVLKKLIPRKEGREPRWTDSIQEYTLMEGKLRTRVNKGIKEQKLAAGFEIPVQMWLTDKDDKVPGRLKFVYPDDLGNEEANKAIKETVRKEFPGDDAKILHGEKPRAIGVWNASNKHMENLEALLKEVYGESAKFALADDVDLVEVPEGYKSTVIMEFINTADKKYGVDATPEPTPMLAVRGLSHKDQRVFTDSVPSHEQLTWLPINRDAPYGQPWIQENAWNVENLTKDDFDTLTGILQGQDVFVDIRGEEIFAKSLVDDPKPIELVKSGSNIAVFNNEEYKKIPTMKDIEKWDEDKQRMVPFKKRSNLYDDIENALKLAGGEYVRANKEDNVRMHKVIRWTSYLDTAMPILKRVPGVRHAELDVMADEIRDLVADRIALHKWSHDPANVPPTPEGVVLYPFQDEGVRFLRGLPFAILADDRGLGKTIQSIVAAESLLDTEQKVLVLTPAKLTGNYYKEIQKFAFDKKAYIMRNTGAQANNEAELKERVLGAIRKELRGIEVNEASTLYGVAALRRKKESFVIGGDRLDTKKAAEYVYRIANDDPKYCIGGPIFVSFIPKDAKWLITSIDTAKGYTEYYRRVLPEKGLPLKWDNESSEVGTVYNALPEDGQLVTVDDIKKSIAENRGVNLKAKEINKALTRLHAERMVPTVKKDPKKVRSEIAAYAASRPDGKWPLVIFDEAHVYKNGGFPGKKPSQKFLYARKLIEMSDKGWFLTGTPISNRVSDLWALLNLTGHELGYGANVVTFAIRYANACQSNFGPGRGRWRFPGAINQQELKDKTADVMMWRYKDDVADIPVQQIYEKTVTLTDPYLLNWNPKWALETNDVEMEQLLGKMGSILSQIAVLKATTSFEEAINAVEEGKKVILFSQYTGNVIPRFEAMAKAYKLGLPYVGIETEEDGEDIEIDDNEFEPHPDFNYVMVTGETPSGQVDGKVKQFSEDPNTQLFIGNTAAAGTGLNLQAATYTVFNDIYWSPFVHEQSEDRTRRIGQAFCTTVVYMVSNAAMDKKVWDTLNEKRGVIERLQEGRDDPNAYADDIHKTIGAQAGLTPEQIAAREKQTRKEQKELEKKRRQQGLE